MTTTRRAHWAGPWVRISYLREQNACNEAVRLLQRQRRAAGYYKYGQLPLTPAGITFVARHFGFRWVELALTEQPLTKEQYTRTIAALDRQVNALICDTCKHRPRYRPFRSDRLPSITRHADDGWYVIANCLIERSRPHLSPYGHSIAYRSAYNVLSIVLWRELTGYQFPADRGLC